MNNQPAEITIKACLLGIILSMVLAGANAYLGLFAGMTVSASIPAAVISMGILSVFKKSNILENNIVQTAASAGESLAAGVIFTIPALLLIGYWQDFNYIEIAKIAAIGGVMGGEDSSCTENTSNVFFTLDLLLCGSTCGIHREFGKVRIVTNSLWFIFLFPKLVLSCRIQHYQIVTSRRIAVSQLPRDMIISNKCFNWPHARIPFEDWLWDSVHSSAPP